MKRDEPAFTLGVEEEYLLVDKETRGLVLAHPATLTAVLTRLEGQRHAPTMRSGRWPWFGFSGLVVPKTGRAV